MPISRRMTATVCLRPYRVRSGPITPSVFSLPFSVPQDAWKPFRVQGLPLELAQSVMASCRGA